MIYVEHACFSFVDAPVVQSPNITFDVGEKMEFTLQCTVDANPIASVKWRHNGLFVNVSADGYSGGEHRSVSFI